VCYDCGVACDLSMMRQERLVFLRRLGAFERDRRGGHDAPEPAPPVPGKSAPERLRPARPGSPPRRYRLRFSKAGPAALLGHLDLVRELPRVIRRTGVRIAYSEGFHPKPQLSFGPALSLGVASLDEFVDAHLIDAPEPDQLVERLNAVTAGGLHFHAATVLEKGAPALSSVITGARYAVALAESALSTRGGRTALEQLIREFLAKESVTVRREIKGLGKLIDVRRLVSELAVGDRAARDALHSAGLVGRLVPLTATIVVSPTGSAKIAEVVEALLGPDFPYQAVRVALLAGSRTPLDVVAERKASLELAAANDRQLM
jgi:radical SAM-linked protein